MNLSAGSRKSLALFLFLAAVFCLLRLTPLFTAVERVYHYDELDIGFIAQEWLSPRTFELSRYQMDPYAGESLLLGVFAVPFVQWLGPTLLAVKIPSLLFSLLTFGVMFLFVKDFFGVKKAAVTALLLIFCHPAYVQFSLAGMTGHTEALFFSAGMLYFFYNFLYLRRRPAFSIFLSGLLGGLAFWIYHENIAMIAACLLSWMILDAPSLKSRFFFCFAAGLALGLLPWLSYLPSHGSLEASFFSDAFLLLTHLHLSWGTLLRKLCGLFLTDIPFSFAFFPAFGIHERILSFFYFLLACVPLAPFAFKQARAILKTKKDGEKTLPLLIFSPVLLIILFLSNFGINPDIGFTGYRYLSILHLFALPLPVLLLPSGKIKNLILGAVLLAGLAAQTALFFREPFGLAQTYKGVSYYKTATNLRFSLSPKIKNLPDLKKEMASLSSQNIFFLLWGFADAAITSRETVLLSGTLIQTDEVLAAWDPATHPFLYEWKGGTLKSPEELASYGAGLSPQARFLLFKGFFENRDGFSTDAFSRCPDCLDPLGPESDWAAIAFGEFLYSDLLAERSGNFFSGFQGDIRKDEIDSMTAKISALRLSPEKEALIYRGLAMGHFRTSWDSNILIDAPMQALLDYAPAQNRREIFWGLGWTVRAMFREDRKRAVDWANTIPAEGRAEALRGFSAFETAYGITGE